MRPTVAPKPTHPQRRHGGVVVPHDATRRQRLGAWLVWAVIRTVAATIRFRMQDESGQLVGGLGGPWIFSIWHNRLALALVLYRRYVVRRQPGRRMAAMVSASRDGAFLARILELFGVEPVRGSSSRRGPQALRELTTWSERGCDLAITPDGPRGPRYVVQDGVTATAQLTGLAILPVSYRLQWKIRAPSWDGFQIPLPFTRCDVHTGPLIEVPRTATEAEREQLRQRLEQTMRAITED